MYCAVCTLAWIVSGITRGSDLPICTSSTCAPDGKRTVSGVTPRSVPSTETRAPGRTGLNDELTLARSRHAGIASP